MPVDPGVIGPATLSLTSALGLFQGFLPSFAEIAATNPEDNPEMVSKVRMGELGATVLALGVGGIMSALTGSPVPSYVAITSIVILVFMYESALRKRRELPIEEPESAL